MAEPACRELGRRAVRVDAGELGRRMGIEIITAEPGRVRGRMPVLGNTQPFGVLHGGASCVLAESLASIGACLHFGTYGGIGIGTEINATHHLPAGEGWVTGTAIAVRLGRTHATYEIGITDVSERRICSARMTCFCAREIALSRHLKTVENICLRCLLPATGTPSPQTACRPGSCGRGCPPH